MVPKLLVATNNQGKVRELAELVSDLQIAWLSLADIDLAMEVEETGQTFVENAVLKAEVYARVSGLLTLADDSGLVVDALDGRPGVYTARYGGPDLTPEERYQLLLRELADVPQAQRTAHFHCTIAIADQSGVLGTADGRCHGLIARQPAGSGGFGYDPVFYLPDKGLTMAQLAPAEKQRLSHRGRAIQAIAPLLHQIVDS